MIGLADIWSMASALREFSYDTVFHVGDTALQFTADLIHGPDNPRHESYSYRQMHKYERRTPKAPAQPKATKPSKPKAEKPLSYGERQYFAQITRRRSGESIIEHWKRRKMMLAHPRKRHLIAAEQRVDALEDKQAVIETEMKNVATSYRKERVPKAALKPTKRRRR